MWICDKDEHCIDCPKNYPEEKCEHWIEVAEVKHGKWIETDTYPKCSVCGLYGVSDMNYCPNCGSLMQGEEE